MLDKRPLREEENLTPSWADNTKTMFVPKDNFKIWRKRSDICKPESNILSAKSSFK